MNAEHYGARQFMSILWMFLDSPSLFQLSVQLQDVLSDDAGGYLAAQIEIDIAPNIVLVAT